VPKNYFAIQSGVFGPTLHLSARRGFGPDAFSFFDLNRNHFDPMAN
jgi:hypothetical protein